MTRVYQFIWPIVFLFIFLFFASSLDANDESICAEVKIEVRQELTLERQAFDAHMRINNGFTHITLENVAIEVSFSDEEGNPVLASYDPYETEALFFIRLDVIDNIDSVDGFGTVQPSTAADIHWLIIPAPGASNGLEQGTLYYVGAKLSYTIGGEEYSTEVSPDYIFVKPMPELTLDYFLPADVYGDDAFTPEIEPPIPFSLGIRVTNDSYGVARNCKIDAAFPKIVDNEQGLLVNFVIEGCQIEGREAAQSLLANFGDIAPHSAQSARWIMTCSLSGEFTEFDAEFSHSDELGGELTSLIEAVNTHLLVHEVLVDCAGRDDIRDFLADDAGEYKVYESEGTDSEVIDQSASSSLLLISQSGDEVVYTLEVPVTTGFMYVNLPDPQGGQKVIKEVVRSDGKRIKKDNAWLSKVRDEDHNWQHFINLFDAATTRSYRITFKDKDELSHPPVLQFIPHRTGVEERQLSFIVSASDPDGSVPSLFASPLPAGADFIDQGDGTGIFDWTPVIEQAGGYDITFRASDGKLEDTQRVILTIYSIADTDGDGMPDAWEMEHFRTLERDGSGDFDGDGITDLDEYINDTNPTSSNAPSVPGIYSPEDGAEVTLLLPALVITNSIDPDYDEIWYEFAVFSDQEMTSLVASQADVSEEEDTTSWSLPDELYDNTWYYWRVRATDKIGFSSWAYGSFFVNTENDPPGSFHISSPADDAEVDTRTPLLEVTNSAEVDEDRVTYTFNVYADYDKNTLVVSSPPIDEGSEGTTSWQMSQELDDNTWYYWQVRAWDEHGAFTDTDIASFFVNTANDAPDTPGSYAPQDGHEIETQDVTLVITNSFDLDEDELHYIFELDRVNTFDSPDKLTSGEVAAGTDTTGWPLTALLDNTEYFWRAKASDGFAESGWAQARFFVNTANDPPSAPTLKNPGHDAWVETLTPVLALNPSIDVDRDAIGYNFQVYADLALSSLVISGPSEGPEWTVSLALNDNTSYYWRAQAEDEHGAKSAWMEGAAFFVNNLGFDDPPEITLIEPSEDILTDPGSSVFISWDDYDPDSSAEIALYYDNDNSGEDGRLIASGLEEDPDDEAHDSYVWDLGDLPVGTYYIYATITDAASSAACYSQGAISVKDTLPPVLICPDDFTVEATGIVTIVSYPPVEVSDNVDENPEVLCDPPSGSEFALGETSVTVTATDASRNISTCSFMVTVEDTVPPAALCEDITIELDADGKASIVPEDVDSGSWDACGIASLSISQESFTCTEVGDNPVTLTVTDINDNVSTCTAMVTVEDTIAPSALCRDIIVQLDAGGHASITPEDVDNGSSDACGIDRLTASPDTFSCDDVGAQLVTLTVTDKNGNVSTCSSTVTVKDTSAPVALCRDITVQLDTGGNISITPVEVNSGSSDACGIGNLTVSPHSFTCENIGENSVTLTVTDHNGNASSCTSTVMVKDTIAPSALCQDITVQLDQAGKASIRPGDVDRGSSDACGIARLTVSPDNFICSHVGRNNSVMLTVSDNNENTSYCEATVTVEDTIPPAAQCRNITVWLDSGGNASITPTDVDNGSSDACGIANLSVSPDTFTCTHIGDNDSILILTDNNGNVSNCQAAVKVLDVTAPDPLITDIVGDQDGLPENEYWISSPVVITYDVNDSCDVDPAIEAEPDCAYLDTDAKKLTIYPYAMLGKVTASIKATDSSHNSNTVSSSFTIVGGMPDIAIESLSTHEPGYFLSSKAHLKIQAVNSSPFVVKDLVVLTTVTDPGDNLVYQEEEKIPELSGGEKFHYDYTYVIPHDALQGMYTLKTVVKHQLGIIFDDHYTTFVVGHPTISKFHIDHKISDNCIKPQDKVTFSTQIKNYDQREKYSIDRIVKVYSIDNAFTDISSSSGHTVLPGEKLTAKVSFTTKEWPYGMYQAEMVIADTYTGQVYDLEILNFFYTHACIMKIESSHSKEGAVHKRPEHECEVYVPGNEVFITVKLKNRGPFNMPNCNLSVKVKDCQGNTVHIFDDHVNFPQKRKGKIYRIKTSLTLSPDTLPGKYIVTATLAQHDGVILHKNESLFYVQRKLELSKFEIESHLDKHMKLRGKEDDKKEKRKRCDDEGIRITHCQIFNHDSVDHLVSLKIWAEDPEGNSVYETVFDHKVKAKKKWELPHIDIVVKDPKQGKYTVTAIVKDEADKTWDKTEAFLIW